MLDPPWWRWGKDSSLAFEILSDISLSWGGPDCCPVIVGVNGRVSKHQLQKGKVRRQSYYEHVKFTYVDRRIVGNLLSNNQSIVHNEMSRLNLLPSQLGD